MQHCYNVFLSNFHSNICQVVAYGRLKTKKIYFFHAFSPKSGHSSLQEVAAYKG